MAETTTTLNDEQSTLHNASKVIGTGWGVLTTLGPLHLAPSPTTSVQEPEYAWPATPLLDLTPPLIRPRRIDVVARCYDIGFAGLALASAAVALYRLVWMGQP